MIADMWNRFTARLAAARHRFSWRNVRLAALTAWFVVWLIFCFTAPPLSWWSFVLLILVYGGSYVEGYAAARSELEVHR